MKSIYWIYIARSIILYLFPVSLFAQPIIWEKVISDKNEVNSKKEIKWELIQEVNHEAYKEDKIEVDLNKTKGNEYQKKINDSLINLGITVPTANTIKEEELNIQVNQVFPSKKGEEGGSGNQNYSGFANYGLNENLMLSIFFAHSDDPLHKKINGLSSHPENLWFSYGGSLRWNLFYSHEMRGEV